MPYLIDTCVLRELHLPRPFWRVRRAVDDLWIEDVHMSTVTFAIMESGAILLPQEFKQRRVRGWMQDIRRKLGTNLHGLDYETSIVWGQIMSSAARRRLKLPYHDSLIAATEVMPALLGLGYYVALSRATGWNDVARTSNPNFGMLTHALFDTHPDDLVAQLRDSKTDSVRVLDTVLAALRELRMALAADDRDTLETVSAEASENYEQWYNKRYHWKFDSDKLPTPEAPGIMTSLFGSFLGNRLNRGGKSDNDKK